MILNFFIRQGKVIVYIDDILIPSSTIQDNLNILKEVLIELKRYNFQLNLQKCSFLKTIIEYLGYIISPKGITFSSRHTEAVVRLPQPKKILELQRFLNFTDYYRKFVKHYASISKPIS